MLAAPALLIWEARAAAFAAGKPTPTTSAAVTLVRQPPAGVLRPTGAVYVPRLSRYRIVCTSRVPMSCPAVSVMWQSQSPLLHRTVGDCCLTVRHAAALPW